jgi:hypothetical protein
MCAVYYAVFDCQNLLRKESGYFGSVWYKADIFRTGSKVIHLDIPVYMTKNNSTFSSNVGVTRYRSGILECDSTLVQNCSINGGRVVQKYKIGADIKLLLIWFIPWYN